MKQLIGGQLFGACITPAHLETVAPQYLLFLRIPGDKLLIRIVAYIKLVYIEVFSRSPSGLPESYLAQPANLFHYIGRIMLGDDIQFIVSVMGMPEKFLLGQFLLQ